MWPTSIPDGKTSMRGSLANTLYLLLNPLPSLGSVDYAWSQGLKHGEGLISDRKMNITWCKVVLNRYACESCGCNRIVFANITLMASFMSSLWLHGPGYQSRRVISFIHENFGDQTIIWFHLFDLNKVWARPGGVVGEWQMWEWLTDEESALVKNLPFLQMSSKHWSVSPVDRWLVVCNQACIPKRCTYTV